MSNINQGNVRVGRSKYSYGRIIYPSYPNFTPIVVLTEKISPYGKLGPYHLKNDQGQILENIWQFSKVYREIPQVSIPYSSGNSKIVWQWPSETHVDIHGNLTANYWKWRMTGKNNDEPVRVPVGWKYKSSALYSLEKDEPISPNNPKLNYIEARKKIYFPIYINAVVKEPLFRELKNRLQSGENLLIIDIDGPHQESLDYYHKVYGVDNNFIQSDSIDATERNLAILLNDGKYPFGHGYCLAWALQKC